jgi:hypothetical protein
MFHRLGSELIEQFNGYHCAWDAVDLIPVDL